MSKVPVLLAVGIVVCIAGCNGGDTVTGIQPPPIVVTPNAGTTSSTPGSTGSAHVTTGGAAGVSSGTSSTTSSASSSTGGAPVAVSSTSATTGSMSSSTGAVPVAPGTLLATVPVATRPLQVAVNPVTNRIYVLGGGGTIVDNPILDVIDGASNTVLAGVPVQGISGSFVVVNPAANTIYTGGTGQGPGIGLAATVVDGMTNAISQPPFGSDGSPAINPITNRIYVINSHRGVRPAVAVIDLGTNQVLATIPIGSDPSPVVPTLESASVNPVTNRVYAVDAANGISVIDGATNSVTAIIPLHPLYLAVNPTTNRLYASNIDGSLAVIDGATNMVLATLPSLGAGQAAVNPVTNRVYVPTTTGFAIVDGATNTVVSTVTTTDRSVGLAVNPVTNRVYVTNVNSNTVTVFAG